MVGAVSDADLAGRKGLSRFGGQCPAGRRYRHGHQGPETEGLGRRDQDGHEGKEHPAGGQRSRYRLQDRRLWRDESEIGIRQEGV